MSHGGRADNIAKLDACLQPMTYARDVGEIDLVLETLHRIKADHDAVFDQPFERRQTLLPILKTMLETGRQALKTAFMANNDGAAICRCTCHLDGSYHPADPCQCNEYMAIRCCTQACHYCNGRLWAGELSPHSDVDLLFLTEVKPNAEHVQVIEFILYLLWDLGLDIGHASRSLRQAIHAAKDDLTIRTALLEARHLAGETGLTDKLLTQFHQDIVADTAKGFIAAKLEERDARHRRSDARRYMLEPNIKEGKGGLRDLHTLFWISRYGFEVDTVLELVNRKVLTHSEARSFSTAQRFLWTLRCHMHFRSGREDDRLSFDVQMRYCPLLGYRDRADSKGVERFMRRYFLTATTVGSLTRIFCAAIADDFNKTTRTFRDRLQWIRLPRPFMIKAGWIALEPHTRFTNDQNAIIDIFRLRLIPDMIFTPKPYV